MVMDIFSQVLGGLGGTPKDPEEERREMERRRIQEQLAQQQQQQQGPTMPNPMKEKLEGARDAFSGLSTQPKPTSSGPRTGVGRWLQGVAGGIEDPGGMQRRRLDLDERRADAYEKRTDAYEKQGGLAQLMKQLDTVQSAIDGADPDTPQYQMLGGIRDKILDMMQKQQGSVEPATGQGEQPQVVTPQEKPDTKAPKWYDKILKGGQGVNQAIQSSGGIGMVDDHNYMSPTAPGYQPASINDPKPATVQGQQQQSKISKIKTGGGQLSSAESADFVINYPKASKKFQTASATVRLKILEAFRAKLTDEEIMRAYAE